MPMRTECKHFESRSYPSGDTVRKCNLDLAPNAPWRCPDDCPKYERRLADAAWTHGSLVVSETPPESEALDDGSVEALLDAAEDILNDVAPSVMQELAEERERSERGGRLRRIFRRRGES